MQEKVILKINIRKIMYKSIFPLFVLLFVPIYSYLAFRAGIKDGRGFDFFTVFEVFIMSMGWVGYVSIKVFPLFRKVVMSQNGCTISWLMFHKTYQWTDFAFIGECSWEILTVRKGFAKVQGIIFSAEPLETGLLKRIVKSWKYLSCFDICFNVNKSVIEACFQIDKRIFFDSLKQWGVSVQKVDFQKNMIFL